MQPRLSLLYVTFPHEEEALKITRDLLERRLIACANILGPIKSLYSWKGRLEESQEVAVLLKTVPEKVSELINILQSLHSYNTPAILEIPLGQNAKPFCDWVHQEVR